MTTPFQLKNMIANLREGYDSLWRNDAFLRSPNFKLEWVDFEKVPKLKSLADLGNILSESGAARLDRAQSIISNSIEKLQTAVELVGLQADLAMRMNDPENSIAIPVGSDLKYLGQRFQKAGQEIDAIVREGLCSPELEQVIPTYRDAVKIDIRKIQQNQPIGAAMDMDNQRVIDKISELRCELAEACLESVELILEQIDADHQNILLMRVIKAKGLSQNPKEVDKLLAASLVGTKGLFTDANDVLVDIELFVKKLSKTGRDIDGKFEVSRFVPLKLSPLPL